jgi:hypothetical protein
MHETSYSREHELAGHSTIVFIEDGETFDRWTI